MREIPVPTAILAGALILGALISGGIVGAKYLAPYQLAGGSEGVFLLNTLNGTVLGYCQRLDQSYITKAGEYVELPGLYKASCFFPGEQK